MTTRNETKIAVLGLGLMGGSLGWALKRKGFGGWIQGYARRPETVRYALDHGLCDAAGTDAAEAVKDADLVVACVPVLSIPELIHRVQKVLKPDAVVTDVGSTKALLHVEMEKVLAGTNAVYVGSHPIAGSEKTGAEAAQADLYEGAQCILTGTDATPESALRRVEELWLLAGCRVSRMSPEAHDRLLARTSHLPHLLSSVLAMTVSRADEAVVTEALCGPGYQGMTRLACGSPPMWKDIFKSNREHVLVELKAARAELDYAMTLLEQNSMEALEAYLQRAAEMRRNLVLRQESCGDE